MHNASLLKTLRRRYGPWLLLFVGCALSAWVALYVAHQINRDADYSFAEHVRDFETAIVRHFHDYDDILFGIAGMYQVADDVTPEQFEQYGVSLRINERFAALRSINFARYIDMSAPRAFNHPLPHAPDRAMMDAAIASLRHGRTELMVITRSYPPEAPGLGVDSFGALHKHFTKRGDTKTWFAANEYAANEVVSSGLPVYPISRPIPSLAARLGIFKKGADQKPRLIGTAGIGFDLHTFFAEAVPASLAQRLDFQMVHVGRANGKMLTEPILVFDSRTGKTGGKPGSFGTPAHMTASFDLNFGGALLRTTVGETRSDLVSRRDAMLPYFIFGAGVLLSTLLALLSCRLLGQNAFLQGALKKKNADLEFELRSKQALEHRLAHSVAEERRRIGRELHDDLGQRLTGISLSAEALAARLNSIAPVLANQADRLERETSDAIACVRQLAHGLVPVPSGAEGLREALASLARDMSVLTKIPCSFDYDDPVDIEDEDVAANLYRIAQEALNNAIRHGKATQVAVHLDHVDSKVVLSVTDNGIGFDAANLNRGEDSGIGLSIMKHRAAVSGYTLTIDSTAGHGTTIKVTQC